MMTDLYGDAAGPVKAFYDHWERCWERQQKGRWFWGMDNFRGEMQIYRWEDFERGRELLEQAASQARDERVKERIRFLQDRYAFTYASARAYTLSMRAIDESPPEDGQEAIRQSNAVLEVWREWSDILQRTVHLGGTPVSGWMAKTDRVRAWGLKQQMRDAVVAPLVRWACANEGHIEPSRLREIERLMAGVALINREDVEQRVTEQVGAAHRKPRADALRPADVPRATSDAVKLSAEFPDWPGVPVVNAVPWSFRDRSSDSPVGKYDEPRVQHYVGPPAPDDHTVRWQAAWDDERLYVRIVSRDDRHEQGQPAEAMWKEDSVQIGINPDRDNFHYDLSSWDYIWGGYLGPELELGISLRGEDVQTHVWHAPDGLGEGIEPASLIEANARRVGDHTLYEAAIDWRLAPGFRPQVERSLGVCVVVNDSDNGRRRSAEYGDGIAQAKRPTEFAAIRLVD
jgi:hypothetical protein